MTVEGAGTALDGPERARWMMRKASVGLELAVLALLAGCMDAPAPNADPARRRIPLEGFSVEIPPGDAWTIDARGDRVSFHRHTTWMRTEVATTLLEVSVHPARAAAYQLTEEELASKFLREAENELSREGGRRHEVYDIRRIQTERGGMRLHGMTYQTISRLPGADPAWADDVWESDVALYVCFPPESGMTRFVSFLLRQTHRRGFARPPADAFLLDSLIESFRWEALQPLTKWCDDFVSSS